LEKEKVRRDPREIQQRKPYVPKKLSKEEIKRGRIFGEAKAAIGRDAYDINSPHPVG